MNQGVVRGVLPFISSIHVRIRSLTVTRRRPRYLFRGDRVQQQVRIPQIFVSPNNGHVSMKVAMSFFLGMVFMGVPALPSGEVNSFA